jgi:hypothetical protein
MSKNIWDALLRIAGEYKGPEIKFFWFMLVLQFVLYLIPDKLSSEIFKLLFALVVFVMSMSFVLLLLISDKGVEDDNLTLTRLLSSYKDPELKQIGKTSVGKKWRATSFLLIAPWTSALVSAKTLVNHEYAFYFLNIIMNYFYYFSIVGILASGIYFFINHLKVLRLER